MLDYNAEAARYDQTRGGEPRAAAAAAALETLLPAAGLVLDVGAGTGIVTTRLSRPARRLLAVERAPGMAARAAARLGAGGGAVVLGEAGALPVGDSVADAVVAVWVLQLLAKPVAEAAVREAARVLRPGGSLVTTVDKNAAAFAEPSDVAELLGPYARAYPHADAAARLTALDGLTVTGEAHFTGFGQGRTPREWGRALRSGPQWCPESERERLAREAEALPEPDVPRPDPRYRLLRFTRG